MEVPTVRKAVESAIQLVKNPETEDKELFCRRVRKALDSGEEFPKKVQSILEKGQLACKNQ